MEKETATHSSVLAWRTPGTEEPGGRPSMGSHRVGHDWSDLAAAAEPQRRGCQRLCLYPTPVLLPEDSPFIYPIIFSFKDLAGAFRDQITHSFKTH